jgi:hypothetical protein
LMAASGPLLTVTPFRSGMGMFKAYPPSPGSERDSRHHVSCAPMSMPARGQDHFTLKAYALSIRVDPDQ